MSYILTPLSNASVGSRCFVHRISDALTVKGRLNELGFTQGSVVDKLQVGSGGSPIACRVCGAVIAVRAEDADKIIVKTQKST